MFLTKTQNGLWRQFFEQKRKHPKHQTRYNTMKRAESNNGNVRYNAETHLEIDFVKIAKVALWLIHAETYRSFYEAFSEWAEPTLPANAICEMLVVIVLSTPQAVYHTRTPAKKM